MREDRRKRYDDEFRHEALGLIKAGMGKHSLARRLAMPVQTAEKWIMKYRSNGEDAVMGAKGKRSYDWETKVAAARDHVDNDMAKTEVMAKYAIASVAPPGALVPQIPYRRVRGPAPEAQGQAEGREIQSETQADARAGARRGGRLFMFNVFTTGSAAVRVNRDRSRSCRPSPRASRTRRTWTAAAGACGRGPSRTGPGSARPRGSGRRARSRRSVPTTRP